MGRLRSSPYWSAPHLIVAAASAVLMARSLFLPKSLGPVATALVDSWGYNGTQVAAALLVIVFGRRSVPEKAAWTTLGAGILLWCTGNVWWSVFLDGKSDAVAPTISDLFWLISYPMMFFGLVRLLRARLGGIVPRAAILDGAIAGTIVSALVAALALEPLFFSATGASMQVVLWVSYPILDVALLGLIAGMASAAGFSVIRSLRSLIIGLNLFVVADGVYFYRLIWGGVPNAGWDTLWVVALAVVAFAPLTHRPVVRARDLRFGPSVAVASGCLALGLLVLGDVTRVDSIAIGLAVFTIILVIIRVASSFQHYQHLLDAQRSDAETDSLTGLGNRRRFMADLTDRSATQRPGILIMIDLDRFKEFNDAYGHVAGDELLTRFASTLRHGLQDYGEVYRLGGDEFCAVLDCLPGEPPSVVDGSMADLIAVAGASRIEFSYGSVSLYLEAPTLRECIALSDERLYAHKRLRKARLETHSLRSPSAPSVIPMNDAEWPGHTPAPQVAGTAG